MAAGLPVVASRIGQLTEVIEDGVNGLLCPPDDPTALADALVWLGQSPELRARLGQAARATVLRDRTWYAVVERLLQAAGVRASVAGPAGRLPSPSLDGAHGRQLQEAGV
jgi:glycosyltransferase involved in cell wall biosynthesis